MKWIREMLWRVAGCNERMYFWLRQSLHFSGGVLVGIITNLFPQLWMTFVGWGILMAIIIWKEIREDKVSQTRVKTITDCIVWTVGFWIVSWVKFV